MLDLLNLPPGTSVYGLKSGPQAAQTAAPGPALQRERLDEALSASERPPVAAQVQRALPESEVAEVAPEEPGGDEPADGEPDVEDLARKVYRILKDKLRVERERSTR